MGIKTTTASTTTTTTTTTAGTTKPFEKVEFGPYVDKRWPGVVPEGNHWNVIGPFRKITVKSRNFGPGHGWSSTRIVQGLILESFDGAVNSFGMEGHAYPSGYGELVEELVVPEGQCINEVKLRYGWYADQIGFVTNKNILLGPVGGRKGHTPKEAIKPKGPGRSWCLYSIGGFTVQTESAPALAGLKFVFSPGRF